MILFNLIEELEKIGDEVRGFLIANERNPIVWIGLFFGGIAIFRALLNVLKSKN